MNDVTRFWTKVSKTRECWLWIGAKTRNGYGNFYVRAGTNDYRWFYAHRFAWEITHGAIPAKLQINHHCDVRLCVRPDHLYAGNQMENIGDAVRRGLYNPRHTANRRRGDAHPMRRLLNVRDKSVGSD